MSMIYLLSVIGVLALGIHTASGQVGACKGLDSCTCQYEDGAILSLAPLSRDDGSPAYTNVSDGNGGFVSWNPCKPFSVDGVSECQNVAVCAMRDGIPYTQYYDLGTQDSAQFMYNVNGSLELHYTSDQGDFKRSAIITLQCFQFSTFHFFVNEGEQEPNNDTVIFRMILTDRYACGRHPEYTYEPETATPYTRDPYMTTVKPLPCTQISTCACMFPDGMVVNLESLTRYDGIPWFANITDSLGNAVSWNLCRSFTYTGTECFNTAVCVIRDGLPLKTYFNLGSDYSARFEADANRNLIITYRSNEGIFKRIASIRLDCDYYSEDSFRLEGETMPDDYTIQFNMVLRSSRACQYMPTTTNPPIYTTEEHNGGCYQGNEICKCSFPNGTDINLEAVSKFDSTPFFYSIATKEGDRISWNPCERFTFKGTSCVDTFVCIQVEEEDYIAFYGFNDPRFSMETNGVQTITFYENENDIKITIALECLKGSENNFLMAERDLSPIGYYRAYRMVLASKYSCPDYY